MAIQMRRGKFTNFLPSKLQPGEWAIVQGEDPSATDGRSVYVAFAAGVVKRMATYTDMLDNCRDIIEQSIEDTKAKLTEKVEAAIAEVKATEAKLYPAAENVLKGAVKDTFVHVDDAFAGAALREITVEGACRQDGAPSPDNPVPIQVIEHPVVKVTGRNLANPSEAYYFAATGKPKAEQIADGFRFTITNNDTRLMAVPCELKKGDVIVVNFGAKQLSGNTQKIQIYSPVSNEYIQMGKPHVMAADASFIAIYIENNTLGEYDVTNFRVSRNVDNGYKPYTSQTLTFALPAEHPYLAKISGKADKITVDKDGNVELVARVGIDKDVREVGDFQRGRYYSLKTRLRAFASSDEDYSGIVLCSALPSRETSSNNEGIYRTWNGMYVRDTSGRTKEELQAEVDKNAPLTVVAAIPEARYPLGKIALPTLPESVSNVWTDAEVTPRTGIEYVRDVNIVVSNLESAIASIS